MAMVNADVMEPASVTILTLETSVNSALVLMFASTRTASPIVSVLTVFWILLYLYWISLLWTSIS